MLEKIKSLMFVYLRDVMIVVENKNKEKKTHVYLKSKELLKLNQVAGFLVITFTYKWF
jgi:hypothetical protein